MQSHVAIATSHAAKDKGWSWKQSLFLSLPLPLIRNMSRAIASLCFCRTDNMARICPSNCVILHLHMRVEGRFNPAAMIFLVATARESDPFEDGSHANLHICMHETMFLPISCLEATACIVE